MRIFEKIAFCAIFAVVFAFPAAGAIAPMPPEYIAVPEKVMEAAAKIDSAAYPDADFVLVEDVEYVEYEADGTSVSWNDEWVLALTEKGRRDLSTIELAANRRYGEADVQLVELYRFEDGKLRKIEVPFRDSLAWATDNSSMDENIYDPQHQTLSCGVPGVRKMDVRHVVSAQRIFKPRMKNAWADMSIFEFTAPIAHSKYIVNAPATLMPAKIVVRDTVEGSEVRRLADVPLAGGRTLMVWEAANVPQMFAEPDMPPMHTQVQRVMLSTLPDWPAVSRWYWKLCLPHLDKMTDEMREKARALAQAAGEDEIARIRTIYRFVAQEIRYMGITAEDDAPGYEPHDVDMTYTKRYGVCRDKAALLAAMLRAAGIEGFPVLIHAGAKLDSEVPLPYFNHAITAARLANGEFILMDPTDESSRELLPAYLSNRSYLVATPEGEDLAVSPVTPPGDNALISHGTGTVLEDGSAVVSYSITFKGINDNAYRGGFLRLSDAEKKRFFTRFASRISPGAEVLDWNIAPCDLRNTEEPLALKFTVRFPELVLPGKTRSIVRLPFATRHIGAMNFALDENTSLEKRRFPLFLSGTCETDETLELKTTGAVGAVVSLPAEASIGKGEGYRYRRSVSCENGTLCARRVHALAEVEFSPEEYAKLREGKKAVEAAERAECVFEKLSDPDADVVQILADTEIHISSPLAWVSTNKSVKSILSYRGKKDSAELQYTWNTAVGDVEIVSAEVTGPDGAVHRISPNEINVMDASWVGAAPRYPASKIMVASLPAVEIGSTISVTSVRNITNSPVAMAASAIYDSNNPIGVKHVAIRGADLTVADRYGVSHTNLYERTVENPALLPREVAQPSPLAWRDADFISAADWKSFLASFNRHYTKARRAACKETAAWARDLVKDAPTPEAKLYILRRAAHRRIRAAGPGSLFEVPFDQAFFPPDVTFKDGYGSRADKMNFLAAALEAAGFDVEVFLCADDDKTDRSLTRIYIEAPNPQAFSTIVLKVSHTSGIWPFSRRRSWWVGGENEYTPIETTAHVRDTVLDTATGRFSRIENDNPEEPAAATRTVLEIRENGSADVDFSSALYGAGVGAFRKKYIEMLPEIRSRHFLELLGNISESAVATSELETDERSYPATMSFTAFVPAFAVVDEDSATVKIPDFVADLVQIGGPARKSPIAVGGTDAEAVEYRIVFPAGYTEIEHLPESWVFTPPGEAAPWRDFTVSTETLEDGRLAVTVSAVTCARDAASVFPPEYFDVFKTANRRASSLAGRTIVVRRK